MLKVCPAELASSSVIAVRVEGRDGEMGTDRGGLALQQTEASEGLGTVLFLRSR